MPGFWCQAPGGPAIAQTGRRAIVSHTQRHIRQPLQAERYRSHSFFYRLLTTPCRIHPICLSSSVESITPPYVLLVEVPGTAPGSKMIISQRIQNHHRLHGMLIINIPAGNCKFLSYNAKKQEKL